MAMKFQDDFHIIHRPAHLAIVHLKDDEDTRFQSIATVREPQAVAKILNLVKYFTPAVDLIQTTGEFEGGAELNLLKFQELAQDLPDGCLDFARRFERRTEDVRARE